LNYFLFLGECGDHNIRDYSEDSSVFVQSGILFDSGCYLQFKKEMNHLKKYFWKRRNVIFTNREMKKCINDFRIFRDTAVKEEFYEKLNLLLKNNDFSVLASVVNKPLYFINHVAAKKHIYRETFKYLYRTPIVLKYEALRSNIPLNIISIRRGLKEDMQLLEEFGSCEKMPFGRYDKHMLKDINIFLRVCNKANNIIGLQLADIIASKISDYIKNGKNETPDFEIIKQKLARKADKIVGLNEIT